MSLNLPENSELLADKAYNDYFSEDALREEGIELCPIRKGRSKRGVEWIVDMSRRMRS